MVLLCDMENGNVMHVEKNQMFRSSIIIWAYSIESGSYVWKCETSRTEVHKVAKFSVYFLV